MTENAVDENTSNWATRMSNAPLAEAIRKDIGFLNVGLAEAAKRGISVTITDKESTGRLQVDYSRVYVTEKTQLEVVSINRTTHEEL